jgi:hypothetical protein
MEGLDGVGDLLASVVGCGAGGVSLGDEVRITREAGARCFGAGGLASGK